MPELLPPFQEWGNEGLPRPSPSDHSQAAIYREWALSALVDAGLLEPGRGQLRTLIEDLTTAEAMARTGMSIEAERRGW